MRLSPLLLIVSMGKGIGIVGGKQQRHQDVAKLLLRAGANPLAKDVFGNTVVHYGAGTLATQMTLEVADMCIRAAKSHHLSGKDVKLHSLNTESMNGKVGVAGGYDPDSERRAVYLLEEKREVWIKIENMALAQDDKLEKYPPLTDIQDRMGTISLHELCMPPQVSGMQEKYEAGLFLLKKHRTSIYIQEKDGVTPFEMCSGLGQRMGAWRIAQLVMEVAAETGREAKKKKKVTERTCTKCKTSLQKSPLVCSLCIMVSYCGKDCQIAHWREGHKAEMRQNRSAIRREKSKDRFHAELSDWQQFYRRKVYEAKWRQMQRTIHSENKTQASGDDSPLLLYDQTRACQFEIYPTNSGYEKILDAVRNEPAYQGRKTYMKAAFDDNNLCAMFPSTEGVKAHYNW
ncbi:hypothetical protein ACHAWO_006509 [Cyclotella atomus]|uniref:MYND-type domain-containing protein n=1 Tax=Cyclotella atomus TaxID=382360 RepID=A0ABD3Q7Z7_9STRA